MSSISEGFEEITLALVDVINVIYESMKKIYVGIIPLLLVTTIIFVYLYTYHSLYRINRNFYMKGKMEFLVDHTRKTPKIVYYIVSIVILTITFITYYFIQNYTEGDDGTPSILAIYLGVFPIICFILALFGLFIFQSKIITFADSPDMKKGITACAAIIFICLLNIFLFNGDKIGFSQALLYVFGFILVFFTIQLLYLVSLANTLTVQLKTDKFDTLSKVCLLGKQGTIETTPYKTSDIDCNCKTESFRCLNENFNSLSGNFNHETEHFTNDSTTTSSNIVNIIPDSEEIKNVIQDVSEEESTFIKNGEDLKYLNGIPIQFYNNNIQKYDDLCIRDFYYTGSYYSYLANTPENGVPDLNALTGIVRDFKCRILHLDIYSSTPNKINSKEAVPIVMCENMEKNAKPILLEDCLKTISKYAWEENENSLPLFLYLRFFTPNEKYLYQKTYQIINEYFGSYLIDKLYGFNERNHMFPVSKLPIKNALGKVILLTNVYPTYTILDEIINSNVMDEKSSIQMKEFKKSYVVYDKQGLLIDYTKNDLIQYNRSNIAFYYTNPNPSYDDNAKAQSKAGLFNPNFNEVAKYGGQSSLMYVYVPDKNMEISLQYFNNFPRKIILKDPFLRYIRKSEEEEIKPITADLEPPTETKAAMDELMSYNLSFT